LIAIKGRVDGKCRFAGRMRREERRSELNWSMVDRVKVRAARIIGKKKARSGSYTRKTYR
jgi:hypothetical protein